MWCAYRLEDYPNGRQNQTESATKVVIASNLGEFPPDLYETLEGVARQKKVSVAWVVRDATEKYVAERWPLFATDKRET